jgi:hypothetical protein
MGTRKKKRSDMKDDKGGEMKKKIKKKNKQRARINELSETIQRLKQKNEEEIPQTILNVGFPDQLKPCRNHSFWKQREKSLLILSSLGKSDFRFESTIQSKIRNHSRPMLICCQGAF